jgi:sucrose-6-phosphate hydrolase SacC (GH32 family)
VKNELLLKIVLDKSSVELFTDEGLTVMTDIFFPVGEMDKIELYSAGLKETLSNLDFFPLK